MSSTTLTTVPGSHKLIEILDIPPATPLESRARKTTSLPLTFLDLPLAGPIYVRRQFFYHFPHPTHTFYQTTLPTLKHSLSLTLQHFFPLAGNLLCPPPPHKPFIRCKDDDSVTLTIIESEADFNHLSSNHPKNLKELNHLVPKLAFTNTNYDDTFIFPLVALQVTVFPNRGLCIAITYCHVMDDSSCSHFIKSWSSICRSHGVDLSHRLIPLLNSSLLASDNILSLNSVSKFDFSASVVEQSPPCFDRQVLKDHNGLEAIFLRDYFEERSTWKDKLFGQASELAIADSKEDFVKATFVFGRDDIQGLKKWVLNQWKEKEVFKSPKYLSKFVVTCAFVWTSLVKTRCRNDDEEGEDVKEEYFRFAADCRDRLGYSVPETYFGNCLTLCHATLKRKDLKGEGGFVNAVMAIEKAVSDVKKEPLRDAENWKATFKKMFLLGSVLLVTGSPKFTVYETDFGFGRPTKVEMVHSLKGMSLAESGVEEGGVEVGLVFRSGDFEYFVSVIEQGLEASKFPNQTKA